jgi:hypothetical protein
MFHSDENLLKSKDQIVKFIKTSISTEVHESNEGSMSPEAKHALEDLVAEEKDLNEPEHKHVVGENTVILHETNQPAE